MKEIYKKQITQFLEKTASRPLSYKELLGKCRPSANQKKDFDDALDELQAEGIAYRKQAGYIHAATIGGFGATVVKVAKTFGFIRRLDDNTDVFIPGKFLCGAMPGDTVLAKLIPSRTGSPEGEILKVLKEGNAKFTGVVIEQDGVRMIQPDSFTKHPLVLMKGKELNLGEKIIAQVYVRGQRHTDHKAIAVATFGAADKAASCAGSILELNGARLEFPPQVMEEAKKVSEQGLDQAEAARRLDLRDTVIFTIDSADTKDIDDAISLKPTANGYELGVHIADVSHYVKPNSALDKEAFDRGTSIYYADKVIPMLPKELSNGICSLNPQEDRLAFSCLMKLSKDGELLDYSFHKTLIRSCVKGVYSEINRILAGEQDEELKSKYQVCYQTIFDMERLADVLIQNRIKRGSPELETTESKLIMDENGMCIDVQVRHAGKSEAMIEEFMLMANQCAARLGREKDLPFVYRVHEDPPLEKVDFFREAMGKMGVSLPQFTDIKPVHMAEVLRAEHGKPLFPVVNRLVLRSMAKAKYATEPIGHFGLVLKDYAHFTSPIRRYPDLTIHRIMTDFLSGQSPAQLKKRYTAFVNSSAEHSTATEISAMRIERDCEDCYKAEYMHNHLGETFTGVISGCTDYGCYVELPNTVEGLVHVSNLPEGNYEYDGVATLHNTLTGKCYTIGDPIEVLCAKTDVSGGKIDFVSPEKQG